MYHLQVLIYELFVKEEISMKILAYAAVIFVFCFVAGPVSAQDCSGVKDQISINKNSPKELHRLADQAPQCGEVWEALGDYYYGKRVWNEAQESYQKALKLLPGKKKIISRLEEIRPKVTALIENENDMLAYRRGLGGKTQTLSGPASGEASPSSGARGEERLTIASTQQSMSGASEKPTARQAEQAKKTGVAGKTTEHRVKTAKNAGAPSLQEQGHKAEKVGLVINFDFNSTELTPQSKKLLSQFAEVLNSELAGRSFLVEGNSDNVGERQYNMQLSIARAESVKNYLSGSGVAPARLKVRGFGFDKPIYDNATEEGRAKNRRVEFEEQ